MKTIKLYSIAAAALLLLATACKKDRDNNGVNNVANNARQFVDTFGPKAQLATFDASTLPQTLTLAGGTKITIPAGALKTGGVAVSGTITVQSIEVLKRSDILFMGANTNHSSGAPLASDGFIYIDIKANGQSVDRYLSAPLQIEIPAKRAGSTQLWQGVNANGNGAALAPGNNAQMAWQELKQDGPVGVPNNVPAVNNYFKFNWGTLGWVNCDIFYSYSNPKTTMTVTVANNPGSMASFYAHNGETFVMFCAKGANVVAQLYTPAGASAVKSYDNTMPVGVEGKLISYCIKDGKYYYAEKVITIAANHAETLTLVETTEAAVQAAIDSMDNY